MNNLAIIAKVGDIIDIQKQLRDELQVDHEWQELVWFRGISNKKHELVPGIYRKGIDSQYEREITRDFEIEAKMIEKDFPSRPISRLFLAQHHGLPTRLLDWTRNPLISLFFAVDSESPDDGAVYCLNPRSLNAVTLRGSNTIPTTESELLDSYIINSQSKYVERTPDAKLPLAIRPFENFGRSSAQSGVFTIHGSEKIGIESIPNILIRRLMIPADCKVYIKRELHNLNISSSTLFKDMDNIAKTLKYLWAKR